MTCCLLLFIHVLFACIYLYLVVKSYTIGLQVLTNAINIALPLPHLHSGIFKYAVSQKQLVTLWCDSSERV